jgi:putative Holliday junction resolvase
MMKEKGEIGIRILGIDPGVRRVGLAISDPLGITARGLDTYDRRSDGEFIPYLAKIIKNYNVKMVVIGKPLSMSGGEIEGTSFSAELAENIRKTFNLEVARRDERLTSMWAEKALKEAGGVKSRGDIDKLAAVCILQDYLDERNS